MNLNARIAYIHAQTAVFLCRIEAMKAENQYRLNCGKQIAYGEDAFAKLEDDFSMLSHNGIISYLRDT